MAWPPATHQDVQDAVTARAVITDIGTAGTATDNALRSSYVAYGPAPSGGNDSTALQAAFNAPGDNGGLVLLRPGTYRLGSQVTIPNKVVVRGAGRSATTLQAISGTFPINTPLVQLGPTGPFGFHSRLEHCTVDANNIAGSTCLHGTFLQERSGADTCVLTNFRLYGVWLDGAGNADMGVENLECMPSTSGATYGIFIDSAGGSMYVRNATCGVQGNMAAGVYVKSCTAVLTSIHVETCTDGIVWDASDGAVMGATGRTSTDAVMQNLVHMLGNSRYVAGFGLNPNVAPVTVKDDFFGLTATGFVPAWVGGDGHIGRLHHYGDMAGFFGAAMTGRPAATGSRGGNAALGSLLTALATLGLIQDNTTA